MIKISITTQKGGVGKSTLTAILANRLCFQLGYNVALVDRDRLQTTIITNYQNELEILKTIKEKKLGHKELLTKEAEWAKEFQKTQNKAKKGKLDIFEFEEIQKLPGKMKSLESKYDFCVFDLPGSLEDAQLLKDMLTFHVIFIPLEPDLKAGSKSIATAAGLYILKNKFKSDRQVLLKDCFLFFNKVNTCSKQHKEEMKQLYQTAAKKGFDFLTNDNGIPCFIDNRVVYQSFLSCSLLTDTSVRLRYTKLENTIQKMLQIILRHHD